MTSSSILRRGVLLELFFLLIVTLVAALPRFYRLEMFPPGLHGDEGGVGLEALRVLEEVVKLADEKASASFKALRFKVYDIEKRAIKRIVNI